MAGAPPPGPGSPAGLSAGYNTELLIYVNGKKKTITAADPGQVALDRLWPTHPPPLVRQRARMRTRLHLL